MVVIDEGGKPRRPMGYKVAPKNTSDLRALANDFSRLPALSACYENDGCFLNAITLLEHVLQSANFQPHVVENDVLPETAAFTIPEDGLIVLRQSVYDGLFTGDPFSRYTVVHEFSHIALQHTVTLHRGATLGNHDWWEDSEWQANNLAAEMLMPVQVVQKLGGRAMLIAAECGVSMSAATFRVTKLQKEGLLK